MRRFRWVILIGELILLALALAVPRMDLPQTAFDETETPVNQATVVVILGCRSALTGLHAAVATTSISAAVRPQSSPAHASAYDRQQAPRSRSLLALLCTLLC
jgi:hypothetical protein